MTRYLRRKKSNISIREFEKVIDSPIDIKELKSAKYTQGPSQIYPITWELECKSGHMPNYKQTLLPANHP